MPSVRRDSRLIDALEALSPNLLRETVWRIVREGRAPCACNASGGRWDDETFDVLYTSRKRDGAMTEMYFHLRRGQPLIPSRVHYRLHELQIDLKSVLDLSDRAQLTALAVDMSLFGQLAYEERASEYPRTQDVAEVSHFLDHSGIVVPNARWDCANVVIFCDRIAPDAVEAVKDHGPIDWDVWAKQNKAKGPL